MVVAKREGTIPFQDLATHLVFLNMVRSDLFCLEQISLIFCLANAYFLESYEYPPLCLLTTPYTVNVGNFIVMLMKVFVPMDSSTRIHIGTALTGLPGL